jgi:hypothetical protein
MATRVPETGSETWRSAERSCNAPTAHGRMVEALREPVLGTEVCGELHGHRRRAEQGHERRAERGYERRQGPGLRSAPRAPIPLLTATLSVLWGWSYQLRSRSPQKPERSYRQGRDSHSTGHRVLLGQPTPEANGVASANCEDDPYPVEGYRQVRSASQYLVRGRLRRSHQSRSCYE